jgi:hypothetical protein
MGARYCRLHIALVWGASVLGAGSRAQAAERPAVERSVVEGPAAERLPEEDQFGTMMRFLAGLVEGSKGCSFNTRQTAQGLAAMRRQWQRFLSEHREEIAAGQHFTVGDPRLPRALFPPGFHFWTVDGHQWP